MLTAHNLSNFLTCKKSAKSLLNGFNMSVCTMYCDGDEEVSTIVKHPVWCVVCGVCVGGR